MIEKEMIEKERGEREGIFQKDFLKNRRDVKSRRRGLRGREKGRILDLLGNKIYQILLCSYMKIFQ